MGWVDGGWGEKRSLGLDVWYEAGQTDNVSRHRGEAIPVRKPWVFVQRGVRPKGSARAAARAAAGNTAARSSEKRRRWPPQTHTARSPPWGSGTGQVGWLGRDMRERGDGEKMREGHESCTW